MEYIHSYSRAQAIEDGFLIDASELATELGIKYSLALTRELYEALTGDNGKIWDLLNVFRMTARKARGDTMIGYVIEDKKKIYFKAIVHAGDDMKPVITIMLPDED